MIALHCTKGLKQPSSTKHYLQVSVSRNLPNVSDLETGSFTQRQSLGGELLGYERVHSR
jgi:hypothetical protein